MTYAFQVHGEPKIIKANNLEEALDKITSKYTYSHMGGHIYFIMSDDPEAPNDLRHLYEHPLFGGLELKAVEELPNYDETNLVNVFVIAALVSLCMIMVDAFSADGLSLSTWQIVLLISVFPWIGLLKKTEL